MITVFEKECEECGEMHFGPREGGKEKGRWLGYDECPKCGKGETGDENDR